jgi:integrase
LKTHGHLPRSTHEDARRYEDVGGLAFTGCRIAESTQTEWRDLDFRGGEIVVKGDPEEGAKNGESRRVPMIPHARDLFTKMREGRADEPATAKVFAVHGHPLQTHRDRCKKGKWCSGSFLCEMGELFDSEQ